VVFCGGRELKDVRAQPVPGRGRCGFAEYLMKQLFSLLATIVVHGMTLRVNVHICRRPGGRAAAGIPRIHGGFRLGSC
jgi:hypothetical protein